MSFLFRLPVYTIVRKNPLGDSSVLIIGDDQRCCAHLFTDADLCARYLRGMRLDATHVGVGLVTGRQLRLFLQRAPQRVQHVVMDAGAKNGKPDRGILVRTNQLLDALPEKDMSGPSRSLRP